MRNHSTKTALLVLAGAALLATAIAGEAAAQTRETPAIQKLQLKPGGGTPPTGPGTIKANPTKRLPDFILEPGLPGNVSLGLPNSGFCKRIGASGPADRVAMKIRFATNGTTAPANGWGLTTTNITFQNGPSANIILASPSWNGTVSQEVNIPQGCYSGAGGCHFTITVDTQNVVPESNNANNTYSGFCASPAG